MIDISLQRLVIYTELEERVIVFRDGLNVVVGPYGSGKTSLLELIKYSLGGKARLSDAVREGVSSVLLDVRLAGVTHTFERSIGSHSINVSSHGDPVAQLHSTNRNAKGKILASQFLLDTLSLPSLRVRRSGTSASSATEPVSFWDLYRYAFVSQNDMGYSIAGHADSNTNRKRRRAFEFMFGLLDSEVAELETREALLQSDINQIDQRLKAVSDFLDATAVPSEDSLQGRINEALGVRSRAEQALIELRSEARNRSQQLDAQRDRIGPIQLARNETAEAFQRLSFEVETRRQVASQVQVEIDQLKRSLAAEVILSPLHFSDCPLCLQPIENERTDMDHCNLCLQAVDSGATRQDVRAEIERLEATQLEVQELVREDERALALLRQALVEHEDELASATRALQASSESYVSPLFDQIQLASTELATANSSIARFKHLLNQWTERSAIKDAKLELEDLLGAASEALEAHKASIEQRREFVSEMSQVFDEIIRELELAWYQEDAPASIDQKTFLPKVGKSDYDDLSGGQRTVVSVAYHLAMMTVGLVHPSDIQVPNILILDTPSKYLGAKDSEQVVRNFRRIAAIIDAYQVPIQIVIADNSEPPPGIGRFNRVELSYAEPLVPGLVHPGGEHVIPIHDPYDEDEDG